MRGAQDVLFVDLVLNTTYLHFKEGGIHQVPVPQVKKTLFHSLFFYKPSEQVSVNWTMKHCPFTKRGTQALMYLELSWSLEGAFTLLQLNANQLIIQIYLIMNIFIAYFSRTVFLQRVIGSTESLKVSRIKKLYLAHYKMTLNTAAWLIDNFRCDILVKDSIKGVHVFFKYFLDSCCQFVFLEVKRMIHLIPSENWFRKIILYHF